MSAEKTLAPAVAFSSLPEQEICREALIEKYAKGKERTVTDVRSRVACALAAAEAPEQRAHWERRFLEALEAGFIPAGRINSADSATISHCVEAGSGMPRFSSSPSSR